MKRALVVLLLLLAAISLGACNQAEAPPDEARQEQLAQIVIAYGKARAADSACQDTPTTTPGQDALIELPPVNPLDVSGDIIAAGSSTVFPLAERMAERFRDEGYNGNITIDSIGSGAGFERFCTAGETDISNASRPIKEKEIENCRKIGRDPVEFRVGTDALAVVVSPENDWADNLTMAQLAQIFSTATTWADIDPAWPDQPIQRFIPGTDSGTFDYFVEEVFDKDPKPILSAEHLQMSEDDNVLVQGVEGSKYAIGFFGYAFYGENKGRLKVLGVEGVIPSREHVDDGSYPLARPLYMYSDPDIMQSKPQVATFLNFVLTYVNDEISDVGYFPASTETLNQSRQNWLDAMNQ
jgi:phosphate transport system substrate-binding protein